MRLWPRALMVRRRPSPGTIQPLDPREQELLDRLRASREDSGSTSPSRQEADRRTRARFWFGYFLFAASVLSAVLLLVLVFLSDRGGAA